MTDVPYFPPEAASEVKEQLETVPGVSGVVESAPAFAASGVALPNPFGYACDVYVSGGTVTAIAVNGTDTGLTSGTFRVSASGTLTITYSVVPSWVWIGV